MATEKKQYHLSKKVCITCPDCKAKVCGISQAHADVMLRVHKKSEFHKDVIARVTELSQTLKQIPLSEKTEHIQKIAVTKGGFAKA